MTRGVQPEVPDSCTQCCVQGVLQAEGVLAAALLLVSAALGHCRSWSMLLMIAAAHVTEDTKNRPVNNCTAVPWLLHDTQPPA